jgi:autotransporter-associated beta strand protein
VGADERVAGKYQGCGGGTRRGLIRVASLGVALLLTAPVAASASTYRWTVDQNGDWNNPANWTLIEGPAGAGYPNAAADIAMFHFGPINDPTFTVIIPDGVTITVGQISFLTIADITFAGSGSGQLVLQSPDGDARISSENTGRHTFAVPIQLRSNLITDSPMFLIFAGPISEDATPRGILSQRGHATFSGTASNTYTGPTTFRNGLIGLARTNGAIAIPGPLNIGLDGGPNATVRLDAADNVADGGHVNVGRFGTFDINGQTETIGDLTVSPAGTVTLGAGATGRLTMSALTMTGGLLRTGAAGSRFVLNGNVTASGASVTGAGSLDLNGSTRVFTVSAPVGDFTLDVDVTGTAGVVKEGPGRLRLTRANTYTGSTVILDGTLEVTSDGRAGDVSLAAGALSGDGIVGGVNAAAGYIGPTNVFTTGSIALSSAVTMYLRIYGGGFGVPNDRLNVAGAVSLGGATLTLSTYSPHPPRSTFTILDNDGADPVNGTFAGLPEGAVATAGGNRFQITYQGGDGNDVVLLNATPLQYSLAEGATGTFFDEDILIANPNTIEAPLTLTFNLPGGGTIVEQRVVPAQARATVRVDEIAGLEATSPSVVVTSDQGLPLAVERTMFWDQTHYGGHTANAVSGPAKRWLFAEGAQGFFDTFLMLANPHDASVDATVTFLRENEPPVTDTITLQGKSRTTVSASTYAELEERAFGMVVDAPQPIAAERAMYFATTPARFWSGGHANAGSPEPRASWFHPEGASGTFFTTFILMSNPWNAPATVKLRFLLPEGDPIEITRTIGPMQRLTINPAAEGIPALENAVFSTVVTSPFPIVSERVMYWPGDDTPLGEGHASSGLTATALDWGLAEGRVGGPNAYMTYFQLANPSVNPADIRVTFLRESGAPVVQTYTLPANSRFNIDVGGMVPELQNESFGARVEVINNVPIAVERSMYWNVEGRFWAGGTNAVGSVLPR